MITGQSNLQAGISYDIAHAGTPRLQPAAWLDGSTGYMQHLVSNFRGADFQGTLTAWIWMNSIVGTKYIVSSADTGSNIRWIAFRVSSQQLEIAQTNAAVTDYVKGNMTLALHTWYHVAVTSNGSAYALYVNGVADTLSVVSGTNSGDWFADTSDRDNIVIGGLRRTTLLGYWSGVIRCVNIWDRALTQPEIAQDMAGITVSGRVAAWRGNGNTDAAWIDQVGSAHSTVYGSPERCLIREGDGAVILNNQILTP